MPFRWKLRILVAGKVSLFYDLKMDSLQIKQTTKIPSKLPEESSNCLKMKIMQIYSIT